MHNEQLVWDCHCALKFYFILRLPLSVVIFIKELSSPEDNLSLEEFKLPDFVS